MMSCDDKIYDRFARIDKKDTILLQNVSRRRQNYYTRAINLVVDVMEM